VPFPARCEAPCPALPRIRSLPASTMQEIVALVFGAHRSAEIPPESDECGKADDDDHHACPSSVRLPEHDPRPKRHDKQRAEEGDVQEERPQFAPTDFGTEGSVAGTHMSMMAGRRRERSLTGGGSRWIPLSSSD
jgi:hypothetical protein